MAWRKLDGSQHCQFHSGLTEQHAVRARRFFKKRQTKPIWNQPQDARPQRVNVDACGPIYAKQTQFRFVEAATLEGWRCPKPARKQAWPTLDRVA